MSELEIFKFLNTGTLSGWTLVFLSLLFWWKGLPTLIEAWEKRSGGIETRLQASLASTFERYDKQLEEADRHHRLCLKEQEILRDRINNQDTIIATQNETIAKLQSLNIKLSEEINALKVSNIQQQVSRIEENQHSASLQNMIASSRRIGKVDGR